MIEKQLQHIIQLKIMYLDLLMHDSLFTASFV